NRAQSQNGEGAWIRNSAAGVGARRRGDRMKDAMHRRSFLTLLGTAAAAWPVAARGEQRSLPVIGFLRSSTDVGAVKSVAAFRQGLGSSGYVEGQNVAIEYRYADFQYDRLPALAADLLRRQVTVIYAGDNAAAANAKRATTTIPVVIRV